MIEFQVRFSRKELYDEGRLYHGPGHHSDIIDLVKKKLDIENIKFIDARLTQDPLSQDMIAYGYYEITEHQHKLSHI